MTDDEKNWLAADYVLGVMRGTERSVFEGQLKNDPVLAKSVLGWQQRLSLIDAKPQVLYPTMSEAEVDAALSSVLNGPERSRRDMILSITVLRDP